MPPLFWHSSTCRPLRGEAMRQLSNCKSYYMQKSMVIEMIDVSLASVKLQCLTLLCLPLCRQSVGHIGLPLSAQCVRVSEGISQRGAVPANTRGWPNAGLMMTHNLWRWANIIPVSGQLVVFGATLNVGINPALDQGMVLVLLCYQAHHWPGNVLV